MIQARFGGEGVLRVSDLLRFTKITDLATAGRTPI